MAYGNWGATVHKNGERQRDWEDATPYKETELESGYAQAFLQSVNDEYFPHHAVLGCQMVRLCGYKHYPVLYVDGKKVDMKPYLINGDPDEFEDCTYEGEIEGYKFVAEQYDGNMLYLKLTEPDGTVWSSLCGYEYGAGWTD